MESHQVSKAWSAIHKSRLAVCNHLFVLHVAGVSFQDDLLRALQGIRWSWLACSFQYTCFQRWVWHLGFLGIISNVFWWPWPFQVDGGQLCQHCQHPQRHSHPCFYLLCTSFSWMSCQRSLLIQASWLPCLLYILYIGIHCPCAWCILKFYYSSSLTFWAQLTLKKKTSVFWKAWERRWGKQFYLAKFQSA